ncbi:MAG: hypothetical protein AAF975_06840, partial [Spirochaetota bacterium]
SNNEIAEYLHVWGLGVVRGLSAEPQVLNLRNYLLRGIVQNSFDLRQGILPVDARYYPFYRNSHYYRLLPEVPSGDVNSAQKSDAASAAERWEYGIMWRDGYRKIETLNRLFRDRIELLLKSDVSLTQVLSDVQNQWQEELVSRPKLLFLR